MDRIFVCCQLHIGACLLANIMEGTSPSSQVAEGSQDWRKHGELLIDLIPDLAGEAEETDRHRGAVAGCKFANHGTWLWW
jgi:hypothetical protein